MNINQSNPTGPRTKSLAHHIEFSILKANKDFNLQNELNNSHTNSIPKNLQLKKSMYASNSSNLGTVLRFGYSHNYQEKAFSKQSTSMKKISNDSKANGRRSPSSTVRLSLRDNLLNSIKPAIFTPNKLSKKAGL